VHGKSQTVPLDVVLDPRLEGQVTAHDLDELEGLTLRTAADIDALHRAVNQIREARARIDTMTKWAGDAAAAKPVVDAAVALKAKLAPIEGRLLQVQMTASEDNLRYPNMLNEQYDSFSQTLDSVDTAPTEPQREVFGYLHGELEETLARWHGVAAQDLPALEALMRSHGVPSLLTAHDH
jgi:hypothetical protein